jgi:SRSO17 transposase
MIRSLKDGSRVVLPDLPIVGLELLDDYLVHYRDLFSRADQARWFALYVRGLLAGDHRKNVESIAESLPESSSLSADLAQSLQHFLTQSPWDADRILARYRSLVRPSPAGRTWVIHDGIVPKKGRHSVGVHRQFARSIGRKVNCQMAVMVSEVNGAAIPFTGRLYLPGHWLREHAAQAERTIPESFRLLRSKGEIAIDLIDEMLPDGPPGRVVTEDGYSSSEIFREGLAARNLQLDEAEPDRTDIVHLARARFDRLKEDLGLNHFEGRTWVGWHHHFALVLVAFGYQLLQGSAGAIRSDTL